MAKASKQTETKSPNRPEKTFRARGVSASVFLNYTEKDGKQVEFRKVQIQRTYKEGEEFKTTSSFSTADLPYVQLVVDQAWRYIVEVEARREKEGE